MKKNHPADSQPAWARAQSKKMGNPVSKITKVAGRRIGGALRAEKARQQKRKDSRH
ncbi:hypothetical protein POL68_35195 [Stigmatella sp. ncwal1]|uniref:Uncharacterized protein n=1 Tax=Stigmatella ashevillensis TaxID=2995309 RepID=A0ABT5DJE2_9BACT|nr:hypothetical protein [Stigmatella ashevillena]MDC0713767.1 hypothetical protein [Stigmatella ashevillena]